MRQEEQHREAPPQRRREPAHTGASDRPRPRCDPLPQRDQDVVTFGATQDQETRHRDDRECHRLDHRERQVAVQLRRHDLRGHHAKSAAEDVGRAERSQRRQERQHRRTDQ